MFLCTCNCGFQIVVQGPFKIHSGFSDVDRFGWPNSSTCEPSFRRRVYCLHNPNGGCSLRSTCRQLPA
jgi:hypothetical protein